MYTSYFFEQAIDTFLKATMLPDSTVKGVNSYLAYYNIGVIYERIKKDREALHFYKICGNYEKAVLGIKRINSDFN